LYVLPGDLGFANREIRMMHCRYTGAMADSTPKRRWFRWPLWTLFVVMMTVGVALAWIVSGYHRTQQRFAFGRLPGTVFDLPGMRDRLPWAWRLCGATPASRVRVSDEFFASEDLPRIRALFPEADEVALISRNDSIWDLERD
jgi:hypothetical protein